MYVTFNNFCCIFQTKLQTQGMTVMKTLLPVILVPTLVVAKELLTHSYQQFKSLHIHQMPTESLVSIEITQLIYHNHDFNLL
jgi:hypothetical protein